MKCPSCGYLWDEHPVDAKPRFKPGMRIAPGHGRENEEILREKIGEAPAGCAVDGKAERWTCESGKGAWFYPDDLDRVIPETKWKPGQMLISSIGGTIHKLLRKWFDGKWVHLMWENGAWSKNEYLEDFDRHEPYPRVGDWVRHVDEDSVGQVERVCYPSVRCGSNWWHIADIEPASPPFEDNPQIDEMIKAAEKGESQPKPTLEGPHWDEIASSTWALVSSKCLLDLREALRELQKRQHD